MNGKKWVGILIVVVVGAMAIGGGLYFRHRRVERQCWACKRPLHDDNIVVAELAGKRHEACCPACVLAMRAQAHTKIRMVSVTDYMTHQPLDAGQANFVVGSDVNTCAHYTPPRLPDDMRQMAVHYDRCAPSIVAFKTRAEAEAFARCADPATVTHLERAGPN